MLNISPNRALPRPGQHLAAMQRLSPKRPPVMVLRISLVLLLAFVGIMFLPWTQNIRADGYVTALSPENRPQTVQSIIGGRIEKWFVAEGERVAKGDTLVFISEIKDEYFDPNIIQNTADQLKAKEQTAQSYEAKVNALNSQIDALLSSRGLKLQQTRNKLTQAQLKVGTDSADLGAARAALATAQEQAQRFETLYADGLKSLTDLENRRLKVQEAQAKVASASNKLLTSRNELINAQVEIASLGAEFEKEIAKAESEKFTALSSLYAAEGDITKLQNKYTSLAVRQGYYYITAPQDGYITRATRQGLGETIKEGEALMTIMPAEMDQAVEMYVMPLDVPLLRPGHHVRLQFDGWPAVVFSGWPNVSVGTYGAQVAAIDNSISPNGLYRVLLAPDPAGPPWPDGIRAGGGAKAMALLKNVPIWYELWRKINGFPPDYYYTGKGDGAKPGAGGQKEEKKSDEN